MNNPDDFLSDEVLEEALAPLRSVAVPEETHEANLAAVHQALAHQIQPTWWRRSVAVPVPLAVAATVAFVFTTGALLKPLVSQGQNHQESPGRTQAELANHVASDVGEDYLPWSKTHSFIHSLANSQVFNTSTVKENRDGS